MVANRNSDFERDADTALRGDFGCARAAPAARSAIGREPAGASHSSRRLELDRNTLATPVVHLIGRLSLKGCVRNSRVVLIDVERYLTAEQLLVLLYFG